MKEAARFAAALDGPIGQRPMQRVIAEFDLFFRDLRADGASWVQIAALLSSAGVRSRSGKPVTDGVLRAMASRSAQSKSTSEPDTPKPAVKSGDTRSLRKRRRRISDDAATQANSGGAGREIASGDHRDAVDQQLTGIAATTADVAARIQRAAQLRR